MTFSGKPDWSSPFVLRYWSCNQHFDLRKGRFPKSQCLEEFFKMAVYLKHFTNFLETIRGGVFLLAKFLKNIYSYRSFLEIFFQIFQSSYFNTFRQLLPSNKKPSRSSCVEVFSKIAVLKRSRKLPGNYLLRSALLTKYKKLCHHRLFSWNFSNYFKTAIPAFLSDCICRTKNHNGFLR